jgi:2,4-didehydro-3-deoxy-L-rhamnonate hydrolase
MKLVRFGEPGAERPGVFDPQGALRDLSSVIDDFAPQTLEAGGLDRLVSVDTRSLDVVQGQPRLGSPLRTVRKFIAVGLNYSDHAAEANMPVPTEPVLFMKASSCLSGPFDPLVIPHGATKVDWEVELGVVIGSTARYIKAGRGLDYVAGYLGVNDVSERAFQLDRGGQWDKGKGCDTFGPIGPWLVTKDEIPDPQCLGLWLDVNGNRRQRGNTARMIFPVEFLVTYISQFMTLEPGDIITTGTPPGVGMGMRPPQYLRAGDVVTMGIDGLGEQRQQVVPC